jgi:hypothetical protein
MIFIEGNVPSSKNSKVNGKFFSKTVQKYLKHYGIKSFSSSRKTVETYKTKPMIFPVNELKGLLDNRDYPITLGFHFVRGTRHKFDFGNVCQILLDLFTAFNIIEDDNMDCIIPMPFQIEDRWYSYDKDNPGVYIKICN